MKDAQSVAGFLLAVITSWTEWRHINMAWLPEQIQMAASENRSFTMMLVGTSEASYAFLLIYIVSYACSFLLVLKFSIILLVINGI